MEQYITFLTELDKRLHEYAKQYKDFLCCMCGCSMCCREGDYPISRLELEYLMQGYVDLPDEKKQIVQNNIKNIEKGKACPFLIDSICSVYVYRPIVCRVHGLAYIGSNNLAILPYCANFNKNYSNVYKNGNILINPIPENLDTPNLLINFEYGEIRHLYDWIK